MIHLLKSESARRAFYV